MAVEAAKAGKDIWCEKPMTRTIGEGKRVVEAVKRNNRIFRLNTWFRFTDTFYGLGTTVEPLKKLIDSGLLGWPLKVTISGTTGFTWKFFWVGKENIDPQMLMPQVDIDSELLFSDITPAFRKALNRFQPFGPGNTAPVFATYGVSNHGDAKLVGMECEHLRMDLIQRQKPNTKIQSIAFQQPTHYEWVRSGRPIDVCYQIVENHYRGTVTTQLRIKDIKPVMNR